VHLHVSHAHRGRRACSLPELRRRRRTSCVKDRAFLGPQSVATYVSVSRSKIDRSPMRAGDRRVRRDLRVGRRGLDARLPRVGSRRDDPRGLPSRGRAASRGVRGRLRPSPRTRYRIAQLSRWVAEAFPAARRLRGPRVCPEFEAPAQQSAQLRSTPSTILRTISTFSCDIAYSDSPAAARARSSSMNTSQRHGMRSRKVQT
jgi:hypothetical protein